MNLPIDARMLNVIANIENRRKKKPAQAMKQSRLIPLEIDPLKIN